MTHIGGAFIWLIETERETTIMGLYGVWGYYAPNLFLKFLLVEAQMGVGGKVCGVVALGIRLEELRRPIVGTLPETSMETQKGYKDYSPSKMGLYGFPCLLGGA